MTTVAPSELRLAKRMARLGTETAFEVLVKARALEARGRDIVHLEIGSRDVRLVREELLADVLRDADAQVSEVVVVDRRRDRVRAGRWRWPLRPPFRACAR